MLKKVFSVVLSFLILTVSFEVNAVGSSDNYVPDVTADYVNLDGYTYYREKNSQFEAAEERITLGKNDVTEYSGDIDAEAVLLTKTNDSVSYTLNVEKAGWYQPTVNYTAIEGNGNDIEMQMLVDGEVPYSELKDFVLHRAWKNRTDEFLKDESGNEYSPEQIESFEAQSAKIKDIDGLITEPLCVALTEGVHTVTLVLKNEKVKISGLTFSSHDILLNYSEYKERNNAENYNGENIVIEGENAILKSSKVLVPLSNRGESSLTPSDPTIKLINYIGGSNWSSTGGKITWDVKVPADGYYNIGFHFHQTYLQEGVSYRALYIDGEIPFKEASAIAFPYKSGWQYMNLTDENGTDTPVYLTSGKHTLALEVTLGELAGLAGQLDICTSRLGKIYRQIVKITGESPDANRDYNLFTAVPDLQSELEEISTKLGELAEMSENVAGAKGGSNAQILRKAKITVDQMLQKKYSAHTRLSTFYDNYASLCSWLYEMQSMALDLDSITLSSPNNNYKGEPNGFLKKTSYTILRLLSSFSDDYIASSKYEGKSIVLWSNWGRDQLNIIGNLITDDFTPKTGIKVNLRITDASLVQAGLSGNGPDVEINTARSDPLNYAMRGILTELDQFDGFEEVCGRFSKNAIVPYRYKGATYGIPDTETFTMLFVRTDIFEELGLEIPKTWAEFINCAKVISLNNMNCGMGAGLFTFMAQMDVPVFNDDLTATNLMSSGAVTAADFWLAFYTKYGFPVSYNFFNRFRIGLMPMAIADYTQYAILKAAAPEINGKWKMVEMPGFVNEDGTINNTTTGGGTASIILDWSQNKEEAWEFIKWWSSEDIQYRFSVNCESVLGVSGRHPTANLAAAYRLGWDNETLRALKSQFDTLTEIEETPGSYYIGRSVQQVYWNVVNNGQDVEDMLEKWIPEADDEIRRKTEEYANLGGDGN